MSHDVFISYSSKQKCISDNVCQFLEDNGLECWIAPRNIPSGSNYGDVIEDAIKKTKLVVLIYSGSANDSSWVNGEINVAFSEGIPIIPFRVENTQLRGNLRLLLNQKHWIDAFPDYTQHLPDLLKASYEMLSVSSKPYTQADYQETQLHERDMSSNNKWLLLWIGVACIIAMLCAFLFFGKTRSSVDTVIQPVVLSPDKTENVSQIPQSQNNDLVIEANGVSFLMKSIDGGTFQMGASAEQGTIDPFDDEKPIHDVTLSSFHMSETEVTQALWKAVMDYEPSYKGGWSAEYGKGDDYPAYLVSWNDCHKFISKLNRITGKQFRLPTEAEWEYAARGGCRSKHFKFAGDNVVGNVAWHKDNSNGAVHLVKMAQANEMELFDMSGNVWEWCEDAYTEYAHEAQTNPKQSRKGLTKVLRGGSWNSVSAGCRVSARYGNDANCHDVYTGFRLVLPQ